MSSQLSEISLIFSFLRVLIYFKSTGTPSMWTGTIAFVLRVIFLNQWDTYLKFYLLQL